MALTAGMMPPALGGMPLVGNGGLVTLKQPTNYFSTSTSLPPLPSYGDCYSRRRWGEDEVIEQAGFQVFSSGYARLRHNVDVCHPVEEIWPKPYEAYMFPKVMTQNVSRFHHSPFSTIRHVPRNPTFQVFPRNVESRTSRDGIPVLGDTTRRSITTQDDKLYRTTQYHLTFPDTSEHIQRKLHRDFEYLKEGPAYVEQQTCSSVITHPDPCPHCWPGRRARPSEPLLASLSHRSEAESNYECQTLDDRESCVRCGRTSCKHKHHCQNKFEAYFETLGDTGRDSGFASTEVPEWLADSGDAAPKDSGFGPWADHRAHGGKMSNDTSTEIHKRPSALHLPLDSGQTQGTYPSERQSQLLNSSSRKIESLPVTLRPRLARDVARSYDVMSDSRRSSVLGRNRWTYRDENNLRLPCVSSVVGTLDKSDAHARFHFEHPDPVPDLRDFKKYTKRVSFFGYNSSVYR